MIADRSEVGFITERSSHGRQRARSEVAGEDEPPFGGNPALSRGAGPRAGPCPGRTAGIREVCPARRRARSRPRGLAGSRKGTGPPIVDWTAGEAPISSWSSPRPFGRLRTTAALCGASDLTTPGKPLSRHRLNGARHWYLLMRVTATCPLAATTSVRGYSVCEASFSFVSAALGSVASALREFQ